MDPERITQPACKLADGTLKTGSSHGSIIANNSIQGGSRIEKCNEGFLTSTGRFVDRKEAAQIAYAAGQIEEPMDRLSSDYLTN